MILSWVSFVDNQKFLERQVCDWAAVQAVTWAITNGILPPPPAEIGTAWMDMLEWQWPKMPEVDEGSAQGAKSLKFKNGLTTFAQELGPQWREQLTQLAEEVKVARELGLPLAIFESKAGAPSNEKAGASSSSPSKKKEEEEDT
jgi:hypothetical protein